MPAKMSYLVKLMYISIDMQKKGCPSMMNYPQIQPFSKKEIVQSEDSCHRERSDGHDYKAQRPLLCRYQI